jgi:hypothetical protein
MLMSLFGRDVRSELFREIASEEPPSVVQHQLLRALAFDSATSGEIAALSLQLTAQSSPSAHLAGASFFSKLAETKLAAAEGYLTMAALYLAVPPEGNPTLAGDLRGMALIASHILGASPKRSYLIGLVAENLRTFIARAVKASNVFSADYSSLFMLLAVLPPEFVHVTTVNAALAKYVTFLESLSKRPDVKHPQGKELTRCVASFLASHPQVPLCAKTLELLASTPCVQSETATLCAMFAAAEATLVPRIYQTFLLPKLLTLQPSRPYVLWKVREPLLQPQDLLKEAKFSRVVHDVIYFKVSHQYFAHRAIDFFPNLILSLDGADLTSVLQATCSATTNLLVVHLLILELLKHPVTQDYLPYNLHDSLLPTIDDDEIDVTRLQITCECLAVWCSLKHDAFSGIMRFIAGLKGIGKCLCTAALFAWVTLSDRLIISIIGELGDLAKLPTVCPYALFALSIVFKYSATRLSALGAADMQLTGLLSIIHNSSLLRPYNFYAISLALGRLLAVLAPDLANPITQQNLRLLIQAFCHTKVPFADQIVFDTLRFAIAFAKEFVLSSMFVFPASRGSSLSLQVSACGAFADMMKLCPDKGGYYFELLQPLLVILQKRNDARVSDFISAIGIEFAQHGQHTPEHISAWVRIVKTVLSNGSLPDLEIESAIHVKAVCSLISVELLKTIAKTEPLLSECLDDLVSSATRAIENSLFDSGFLFFSTLLDLFKQTRTANGVPLLELYDSQFSIAVRVGFSELLVAGDFLFAYLLFHEHNLRTRPADFSTVVSSYLSGFEACEARNDSYFALASLFADVVRTSEFLRSKASHILPRFEAALEPIVLSAVHTLSASADLVTISTFGSAKARYYRYLLVSFAWLHATIGDRSHALCLVEFLVAEIAASPDEWRLRGAIDALSICFEYLPPGSVPVPIIDRAVAVVSKLSSFNFNGARQAFLGAVSRLALDHSSDTWSGVLSLCINSCFDYRTIARLIGKTPVRDNAMCVIDKLFERGQSDVQCLSLLTITMPVAWQRQLDLLCGGTAFSAAFRLQVMTRVLKVADDISGNESRVSDFFFGLFKRGGMNALAAVVIARPSIAYSILSVDNFSHIRLLCERDVKNCDAFLQFLLLVLEKCQLQETHAELIATTAMKCVLTHGSDPQRGREVIGTALRLVYGIDLQLPNSIRRCFAGFTAREQQMLVRAIDSYVTRVEVRKNALTLKQFSDRTTPTRRGSSDGEDWQTLDLC